MKVHMHMDNKWIWDMQVIGRWTSSSYKEEEDWAVHLWQAFARTLQDNQTYKAGLQQSKAFSNCIPRKVGLFCRPQTEQEVARRSINEPRAWGSPQNTAQAQMVSRTSVYSHSCPHCTPCWHAGRSIQLENHEEQRQWCRLRYMQSTMQSSSVKQTQGSEQIGYCDSWTRS